MLRDSFFHCTNDEQKWVKYAFKGYLVFAKRSLTQTGPTTPPRMGSQSGLRFKISGQLIYHAENSISLINLRLRC